MNSFEKIPGRVDRSPSTGKTAERSSDQLGPEMRDHVLRKYFLDSVRADCLPLLESFDNGIIDAQQLRDGIADKLQLRTEQLVRLVEQLQEGAKGVVKPEDFGDHQAQVQQVLAWAQEKGLKLKCRAGRGAGSEEIIFEIPGWGVFDDLSDQKMITAGGIGSTSEEAFVDFLQHVQGRKLARTDERGYAVNGEEENYQVPENF